MARVSIATFLALSIWSAASIWPATAQAQDSAYENELGHAMHAYYAGRLAEAQNELNQLIRLFPGDSRAFYFRGLCAWRSGRATEARQDFSRAAEVEQANPDRSPMVSVALARVQGPARQSLESYRTAVRIAVRRQRDAERLARYGLGPNQQAVERVASAAKPAATETPADAQPLPATPADAAAEKPAADKVADDPFSAPAKTEPPAEDPFAAPAKPPAAAAMPVAEASPPAADMSTPDATVAAAIAAIDQPQDLWVLLPSQYQADLKGLVNDFGNKMDAELWDRTFVVLKKLVKVGKEKRDLILKQPMLAGAAGADDQWDQVMELFDTLLASEIGTVQGLKTFDPSAFFAGTGSKLAGMLATAPGSVSLGPGMPTLDELKTATISVVKSQGDTATIRLAIEGKPPLEFAMKRVDGKWLPAALVDGWTANISAAKASLAKLDIAAQKPQGMMMLQMADGVLDQLLAAQDEAAFNAALGPVLGMVLSQMGGKLPGGGAMPGGVMPGGPPPGFPGGAMPPGTVPAPK